MPQITIPLPRLGVDLRAQEADMRAGCVRHAVNVDMDAHGQLRRRAGFEWLYTGQWQTLFSFAGCLIAQQGRDVWRIDPQTLVREKVAWLDGSAPIDCTIYNQALYFVSARHMWRMAQTDSAARIAGVAPPAWLPDIAPVAAGQIPAGQCAVALSWIDGATGEESAARFLGHVDIPAPSGGVRLINLPQQPGRKWLVYLTPPDGEVLRLADTLDATAPHYSVLRYPRGAQIATLDMAPMPGGQFVRGFGGRLLVANGATLYYSEALRPHWMHAAHGFIAFASPIRFIEPLAGSGVFVGQSDGVYFLAGDEPQQWRLQKASDAAPVAHSGLLAPMRHFGALQSASDAPCAMWLSAQGHCCGLAGGEVIALNAQRIRANTRNTARSACIERGGITQIITLAQAPQPRGAGIAKDTIPAQGFAP